MENNTIGIGKYAGLKNNGINTKNCVFIGYNAGADILEGEGIVIIGDDVRSLNQSQENIVFIGNKVAIGSTLFGKPLNFKEILENYLNGK